MKSPEFAAMWTGRPIRDCGHSTREFDHPQVGRMTLTIELLPLNDDPGQCFSLVSAERGSTSEQSLQLLASLVATDRDARQRAAEHQKAPAQTVAPKRSA